jgi:hypothetical protein
VDPATPARYPLDIADDTFVVAAPAAVAELVRDPAWWPTWWPDLRVTVSSDRGPKGMQWTVRGAVQGSMEIWLEPWGDGVIVHWYLRAEPVRVVRRPERAQAQRARHWKEQVSALKDRLEAGREPGSPREGCEVGDVKDYAEPAESP